MNEAQIKHMVDRFLGWKLPDNFNPDGGVTFTKTINEGTARAHTYQPSGTNILDAVQATAMVQHMVEGLPSDYATATHKPEFAWLIEAPGPRYLAARKLTTIRDFVWTTEHNLAVRLHSEDQAELTMGAVKQLAPALFAFEATLGNARPVEHGWMGPDVRVERNRLYGYVNGLLGLLQLVRARDDMPASLDEALNTNHRATDAAAYMTRIVPPTPEEEAYLDEIEKASTGFDPTVVVGGPR